MKASYVALWAIALLSPALLRAQNVYVANYGNGTVDEYNSATGAPVAGFNPISGLNGAFGLALSGGAGILYVSTYNGGTIGEYNATTGAAINANFITGLNFPYDIALSGNTLYVAIGSTVNAYNATTGTPAAGITAPSGLDAPLGVAVSGNRLYVADAGNNSISEYDATTGAASGTFASPVFFNPPHGMAVWGNILFISETGSNVIGEYNANTGAMINANFITGASTPYDLSIFGNDIFVANASGQVQEYDLTTGQPVDSSNISSAPVDEPIGIVAAPEPGSAALLLLGVAAAAGQWRRKGRGV